MKFTLVPNLAWVDDEIVNVATKLWVGQNDGEHDYSLLNPLVETVVGCSSLQKLGLVHFITHCTSCICPPHSAHNYVDSYLSDLGS